MSSESGHLLELILEKRVPGGEGLARHDGLTIFVPGGLPGDRVKARVISRKPSYARALIEEVLTPGPERREPPCPVTERCGGCQWQHQHDSAQLESKHALLCETLSSLGGWDPALLAERVAPVLGMAHPWHYRNKGQFPVQKSNGQTALGFFGPRSHTLVPIDTCLIQHATINAVLAWVQAHLPPGLSPYDETTQQGLWRHLIVRHGFHTNQTLVGLVLRADRHAQLRAWAEELRAAFPSVVGVVQNIHPAAGNRILGPETTVISGQASYLDQLGTLQFEVSLPSFFQVNPLQTEVLYDQVRRFAAPQPGQRLIDAYAGAGTIAAWLAQDCEEVLALEVVPEAVADGRRNAARNGLTHLHFETGRVEDLLPRRVRAQHYDSIVLDPPRKGCEPAVLDAVIGAGLERVVYVSCNPATLARDSARLRAGGYQLIACQPVDMFPHTHHLESVSLFQR
ncbi:MAG: 23S rRNA (uracil(1939)-C(5))-methyltransferase RlmD [Candidatus Sericytochromatia bacterium]